MKIRIVLYGAVDNYKIVWYITELDPEVSFPGLLWDFFMAEKRYNEPGPECWNGRQARFRTVWIFRGGSSPLSGTHELQACPVESLQEPKANGKIYGVQILSLAQIKTKSNNA